jgi:hypothetical protein
MAATDVARGRAVKMPVAPEDPAALVSASDLATRVGDSLGERRVNLLRTALGIKSQTGTLSAQMVNTLLEELCVLTKEESGQRALTSTGQSLGAEVTGPGPVGEPIRVIRWRPDLEALLTVVARARIEEADYEDDDSSDEEEDEAGDDTVDETASEDEELLDYRAMGNLRRTQIDEYEGVVDFLVQASGRSRQLVSRRLNECHGRMLVRNAIPELFNGECLGAMTARTAINFRVVSELAAHLDMSAADVQSSLEQVAGQTLVRSVFPQLLS